MTVKENFLSDQLGEFFQRHRSGIYTSKASPECSRVGKGGAYEETFISLVSLGWNLYGYQLNQEGPSPTRG